MGTIKGLEEWIEAEAEKRRAEAEIADAKRKPMTEAEYEAKWGKLLDEAEEAEGDEDDDESDEDQDD
jgi:hypothetical protein